MCYLHYFMFHYYLTLINLCIPFNLFVHVHIITVLVKNKLARAFSQGFTASVAIQPLWRPPLLQLRISERLQKGTVILSVQKKKNTTPNCQSDRYVCVSMVAIPWIQREHLYPIYKGVRFPSIFQFGRILIKYQIYRKIQDRKEILTCVFHDLEKIILCVCSIIYTKFCVYRCVFLDLEKTLFVFPARVCERETISYMS